MESTDESPGSLISIVIDDFDVQYNSIGVCFQGFYFDIACAVFGPFSVVLSPDASTVCGAPSGCSPVMKVKPYSIREK